MMEFYCEKLNSFLMRAEDLRAIITGKIVYGSCPLCNGTGRINWNEDGEDTKPGPSNDPSREEGNCDNCEGVGFIIKIDNR